MKSDEKNEIKVHKKDVKEYQMTKLENTTSKMSSAILPSNNSPQRPVILNSKLSLPIGTKMLKLLPYILKDWLKGNSRIKAIKDIKNNIKNGKKKISKQDLEDFQELAIKLGIGKIGFTDVPREMIFQEKGILYDQAIICVMKMDKEKIAKAPSIDTVITVVDVYTELGHAINVLTHFLRKRGYECHAANPLKGLVLFPPLAIKAGMGWMGRHGLLITPEFGTCQRIGGIFLGVDNLPLYKEENPHKWIGEFCKNCGKCIKKCPGSAILSEPIKHLSGRITCIDNVKCFEEFNQNYGCAVCLNECAFNKKDYGELSKAYKKSLENS